MRPVARSWAVAVLLITGAVHAALAEPPPEQRVSLALSGWPIGDFELVDHQGRPFTRDALDRHWTFLILDDARCGGPCALALTALSGLFRRIAGTKSLESTQVIYVSLNPADTAADLSRSIAPFDPRFVGVGGSGEALSGLCDDLGISAQHSADPQAPTLDELAGDGSLWLIGPDGVIRSHLFPPYDIPRLTAVYLRTRLKG